ncbi:uncharacterized protein F5Z01DRAFT_367784 [Emericellopsis atlantica]|uniref:Extracellular membrane protein CFEM domain-containing protein n=1 Tax=Emericellopsis atlantica TaxID=2614577 RepID=A0A9P7ZE88_9HYPO|nr:uncharacterized protein F5Z01DRAFT_367784 [Emericellopsis atlantica]KAG9250479.1 hypothetical protein F5Z01DRAFT_367784 [Emericellopsis atlantica]
MFLLNMALAPPTHLLYSLIFLITACAASDTSLSPGVLGFIPTCAERCVASFVQVNYEGTGCGEDASLQCLCSTRGNTEFTLGEGVVQCITTERRFGQCSDYNAGHVTDRAYFMCNDELRAVQPTHTLITASLVLPTTRGGFVSFPQVSTKTGEPTSLPSTLVTETSPSPTVRSSTTQTTRTSGGPTSTTVSTGAAQSTSETMATSPVGTPGQADEDEQDDEDDGGGPALGTGQIAGISIGVVAAAGVAIGAIFLARRYRKKRHPGVSTGFLPRRSTWGYLGNQRPEIASLSSTPSSPRVPPPGSYYAAPVPPPPLAARKSYSRTSWYPGGIGMALSPPFKKDDAPASPKPRRISKLLPAKPTMTPILARFSFQRDSEKQQMGDAPPQLPPLSGLSYRHRDLTEKQLPQAPLTLHIPEENTLAVAVPSRMRDSAMTEFEEDGGSSVTSPQGQVWRHPSQNLASSYVADKNGNWVLRTSAKPDQASSSSAVPMTAPPTQNPNPFRVVNVPGLPPARRSLSQRESARVPHLAPAPVITRDSNKNQSYFAQPQESPTPKPLFSTTGHGNVAAQGQDPFPQQQNSKQWPTQQPQAPPVQRDRASSRSSDTTIFESSSDESKEPTPPEAPPGSLSPVVESAESPASASVSRPPVMVQPGQGSFNMNYAPPPRRPKMYQPPGQPSPTLGIPAQQNRQQPPSQGSSSYNMPSKGRQPTGHQPASARTGSPTMRVVEPSPEPDDRGLLPSVRGHHRRVSSASRPPHQQVMPSPTQQQRHFSPPQPRPGMPQHPYQQPRQQDGPYPRKPTPYMRPAQIPAIVHSQHDLPQHYRPAQNRPPPPPLATNLPSAPAAAGLTTFVSPVSEASTSSSLLAKRLGFDRAAQMAIPTDQHHSQRQGGGNRRRDAPPPPHTPRQGSDGGDDGLPRTPGWMPKLTPTRRGGDLFLNVQ